MKGEKSSIPLSHRRTKQFQIEISDFQSSYYELAEPHIQIHYTREREHERKKEREKRDRERERERERER